MSSSTSRNRCQKKTTVSLQPYFSSGWWEGWATQNSLELRSGTRPAILQNMLKCRKAQFPPEVCGRGENPELWNIPPMDVLRNIGNQPKISKDQFMWGKT